MKTIAFNGRPSNTLTFALVLGGLLGYYFYRRQGGSVNSLVSAGRGYVDRARDLVSNAAPSIRGNANQSRGVQEISTSPEALDGLPTA